MYTHTYTHYPEKYQIMDTKSITLSFMWYAQSSDGKVGKVIDQF